MKIICDSFSLELIRIYLVVWLNWISSYNPQKARTIYIYLVCAHDLFQGMNQNKFEIFLTLYLYTIRRLYISFIEKEKYSCFHF